MLFFIIKKNKNILSFFSEVHQKWKALDTYLLGALFGELFMWGKGRVVQPEHPSRMVLVEMQRSRSWLLLVVSHMGPGNCSSSSLTQCAAVGCLCTHQRRH